MEKGEIKIFKQDYGMDQAMMPVVLTMARNRNSITGFFLKRDNHKILFQLT
jgi:hypothetical protein